MTVTLIGYNECPSGESFLPNFINTTSRSKTWSIGLSPFYLGPIELYDGSIGQNFENIWQFSKAYQCFVNEDGSIKPEYWKWRRAGFNQIKAERYPMGKGAVPLFSFWDDKRLSYVDARKQIYIPLYKEAVEKTKAYARLKEEYDKYDNLLLWDFDGYDRKRLGMSFDDVINCETRKMGHALVLEMMLEGYI